MLLLAATTVGGLALAPPASAAPAATTGSSTAAWPGPQAALSDWPQFLRGAYRQGFDQVESTLVPATVGRLGTDWSKTVAGSGWSPATGSPVVVGDAVFLGGATATRRSAVTGQVVWSTAVAAGGLGVPTTPAYGHGIVVAANAERRSTVAAIDAVSGAVLWRHRLQGAVSSSPTVSGGSVYVGMVTGNGYSVVALDLRTGRTTWTWRTVDPIFGLVSSPTTDGKTVFVSTSGGTRVVALSAARGTVRWSRRLDTGNGWTFDGFTMSLQAGQLYLGNVSGAVYDLDAATGATVWRVDTGGPVWRPVLATPTAVLVETGVDDIDTVRALSPSTGRDLWTYRPGGSALSPELATAGGVVYIGSSSGGVGQLDAVDLGSGARLARVALTDTFEPMGPAVSAGHVYVADWEHLLSLGLDAAPGTAAATGPATRGVSTPTRTGLTQR